MTQRSQTPPTYLPETWSNPQSSFQYIAAARDNLLNIVPPSSFTQGFTTFPSRFGDTHYISDPKILREILKTRPKDFPKSRSNNLLLEPVIPRSIFIASGDNWAELHKLMIPVFTKSNIKSFEGDVAEISRRYLDAENLENWQGRDITPMTQDITFAVISQILLSDFNNPGLAQIRGMFETFLDQVARIELWDLLALRYDFLPNMRKVTRRGTIKRFEAINRDLVQNRLRGEPPEQADFMELLIRAFDLRSQPTRENINIVKDNLITFLIAGHETTALTLAWGLYALSFFPEAQEAIAAEADLPIDEMVRTEAAIKEIMRIYPAAPMLARRTNQPEQLGDLSMKEHDGIIIPMIAIHRHREHWDRPDEFIPERFLDFTPPSMTYLPFGAGPRVCIGASFAMMEAKIILSQIMKRYQFSPSDHVPKAQQVLTLRAKHGIQLQIKKR